jgi:hypothetical protein
MGSPRSLTVHTPSVIMEEAPPQAASISDSLLIVVSFTDPLRRLDSRAQTRLLGIVQQQLKIGTLD